MLHFYPSNHAENLAITIAQIMALKPLPGAFDEEVILVQSQGVGTWLQQQISSELGVAAMIDTTMPASFIWKLSEQLLPGDKLIPRFEKHTLRWELMRVLPTKLEDPKYRALAQYLFAQQGSDESLSQNQLFKLCDRIADLYDAYQNYRSDWIAEWEQGQRLFKDESTDSYVGELEAWQADLWISLYPEIEIRERLHRPHVLDSLTTILERPDSAHKTLLPSRLFIFGLSALPPQWLPLFERLSRSIDVHFLAFNPCQQYWGDLQTQGQQLALQQRLVEQGIPADIAADSVYESNPLLASWGRLGRDYVSLISESDAIREISVDLYEASEAEHSALHGLQNDILNLESNVRVVADSDDSIRFAVCHSRLREVEALHDYLLDLLDRHPSLSPRDIIVMMPDVQAFSPFVEAVFSRPVKDAHGQSQFLPYAISDQLIVSDQPLVEVIQDTLSLPSKRLTAKEILAWLEVPAIRSRFDIADNELEQVLDWVEQLHVRWGLSESHRDQLLAQSGAANNSEGSGAGNTWLHALRRLLAGCLYSDSTLIEDERGKVLPYSVTGMDNYLLAGKVIRFIDVIQASISDLSGCFTMTEWLLRVSKLWQNWFDESLLPDEVKRMMDQSLETLEEQVQLSGFGAALEFDLVAEALSKQFQSERVSQRFLAGRINFCTLMPMRSIPFKVVCLIGMNEGEYPRVEVHNSFDLMASCPGRLGDRSRRNDDRYLFLEALCSARDHLYMSYTGYDLRDNSERFPSVLVSEFRDYCDQTIKLENSDRSVVDAWTTKHRLQPFHPEYYQPNGKLPQSYCIDWLALHIVDQNEASPAQIQPSLSEIEETIESVSLDELVVCANHPLKAYYQLTLGVSLSYSFDDIHDAEPFAMNGLELYQMKQDLVASWGHSGENEEAIFQNWQFADRLPRSPVAELYYDIAREGLIEFKTNLKPELPLDTLSFSESFDGIIVDGELNLNQQGLVMVSLSKGIGGQFFGYWVRHVLWNCLTLNDDARANLSRQSQIFTPYEHYQLAPLDQIQAKNYLSQILAWYQNAICAPCAFLPKTAFAALFEKESDIKKAFHGMGQFSSPGECEDPYWQRACYLGDLQADASVMPEFEEQVLFDQVFSSLEQSQIVVKKLGKD